MLCETITQTILPNIIIIFGWFVVNNLSKQRERKQEWRKIARETIVDIDKIVDLAIAYHTSNTRDKSREDCLKLYINNLDEKIDILRSHLNIKRTVSFFRSAITLNNFQDNNFKTQPYSSSIIQDISTEALRLKNMLYEAE